MLRLFKSAGTIRNDIAYLSSVLNNIEGLDAWSLIHILGMANGLIPRIPPSNRKEFLNTLIAYANRYKQYTPESRTILAEIQQKYENIPSPYGSLSQTERKQDVYN